MTVVTEKVLEGDAQVPMGVNEKSYVIAVLQVWLFDDNIKWLK